MASLFRPLRRALLSLPSSSPKALILVSQKLITNALLQTRPYKSEMRKFAFANNILRLIRKEIDCELEHCPKSPADEFNSYTVDCQPGEKHIKLKGQFEEEEITIDVTMFDGILPVPKSSNNDPGEDMKLHITFIVDIYKRDGRDILEFLCSAWPDFMEVQKVFVRARDRISANHYLGPEFKEMDADMQDALMDFLESRGINDDLAVFLHEYIMSKEKAERLRWMGNLKSLIENRR